MFMHYCVCLICCCCCCCCSWYTGQLLSHTVRERHEKHGEWKSKTTLWSLVFEERERERTNTHTHKKMMRVLQQIILILALLTGTVSSMETITTPMKSVLQVSSRFVLFSNVFFLFCAKRDATHTQTNTHTHTHTHSFKRVSRIPSDSLQIFQTNSAPTWRKERKMWTGYVFFIGFHTHISWIKSTFKLHICISIVALYH